MRSRGKWDFVPVAVATVVAVAACAPVDKSIRHDAPPDRSVVEPVPSDPDRIAGFYDRLLTLKAHELVGELDAARQSFEKDRSELNRVQLALLLSLPGTGFRDDNAAISLLHPIVKDKGREGSTLRPLAILLHTELVELRRSDEALQQQSARLKEESAKLKEEQRHVEALQQKLEAILDMEMKMIEREQNLPKKR